MKRQHLGLYENWRNFEILVVILVAVLVLVVTRILLLILILIMMEDGTVAKLWNLNMHTDWCVKGNEIDLIMKKIKIKIIVISNTKSRIWQL